MRCPYTWFRTVFSGKSNPDRTTAENLRVRVVRNGEETLSVALPAESARWLMDLIPKEVIQRIEEEKIPLDEMVKHLESCETLIPQSIFSLKESTREVEVWLE